MRKNSPESTGLIPVNEQLCPPPDPDLSLPGRAWITAEAITDTQRVWSPYYERELTKNEAVEILMNVKNLAEVLVKGRSA